jgi:hypothetical protein
MKHVKLFAMWFFGATVLFTSCKPDEEEEVIIPPVETPGTVVVTSNITSNTTWAAGTIYQLAGRITVTNGATLTIEPGTIVKGEAGTGANATALLVARGGKLNANGTAASPVIFTSVADELDYADMAAGNFASPNLEASVNGLWGGLSYWAEHPFQRQTTLVM